MKLAPVPMENTAILELWSLTCELLLSEVVLDPPSVAHVRTHGRSDHARRTAGKTGEFRRIFAPLDDISSTHLCFCSL